MAEVHSVTRPGVSLARSDNKRFRSALQDPAIFMTVDSTAVTIRSLALIKALKSVVAYYPQVSLDAYTIALGEPYALIAHHLDELEEFRSRYQPMITDHPGDGGNRRISERTSAGATPNSPEYREGFDAADSGEQCQPTDVNPNEMEASVIATSNESQSPGEGDGAKIAASRDIGPNTSQELGAMHLGLLLEFLNERFALKQQVQEERARHRKSPAACTFRMLWLLFKPGSTVYVQTGDAKVSASVVQSITVDSGVLSSTEGQISPLAVKLWHLDFDGRFVGRRSLSISIPHFDGERAVTSLRVFPCHFLDQTDGGETRNRLEKDGARWYKLLQGGLVHYDGELLGGEGRSVSDNSLVTPKLLLIRRTQYNGRIFVDSASCFRSGQSAIPVPIVGRINDMWPGLPEEFRDTSIPPTTMPPGRSRIPPIRMQPLRLGHPLAQVQTPAPGFPGDVPSDGDGSVRCSCELCQGRRPHPPPGFRWTSYDGIDPKTQDSLEDSTGTEPPFHKYLLCSRELRGLALKTRKWGENPPKALVHEQ
jgi:hypothetical protein